MPSGTYIVGMSVAKTLAKHFPEYNAHLSNYGSDTVFPGAFERGDLDIGILTTSTGYQAAFATGAFEGKEPAPVRQICTGNMYNWGMFATPGSGIEAPADIEGKKWMARRPGSLTVDQVIVGYLQVLGLTEAVDVTIIDHTSVTELTDALKEGRVDAGLWPHGLATAWMQELVLLGKVKIISHSEEFIEKFLEIYPFYVPVVVPGGHWKGHDEDILTFGSFETVSARESLPADQVYEITRTLYEDFDTWLSYNPENKYYGLPGGIDVTHMAFPFHEGAIRYYREAGFWTAEHEAKQKDLLDKIAALKK